VVSAFHVLRRHSGVQPAAVSLVFSTLGAQSVSSTTGPGERFRIRRPTVSRITSGSEEPDAAPSPTRKSAPAHMDARPPPRTASWVTQARQPVPGPPESAPTWFRHRLAVPDTTPKGGSPRSRLHCPEGQLLSHRAHRRSAASPCSATSPHDFGRNQSQRARDR